MRYKIIILVITLFSITEGFGLRSNTWGGLGTSNIGFFGLIQLFVIIINIYIIIKCRLRYFFNKNNSLSYPLILIFITIITSLVYGLILSFVDPMVSSTSILTNFFKIRHYFLFFIFTYVANNSSNFNNCITTIKYSSVVCSIILLLIVTLKLDNTALNIMTSDQIGREFRIIAPSAMLITLSYFIIFTEYKFIRKKKLLFIIILCLTAILLQMHRTVLITIILVNIYALYKLYGLNLKNIFTIILILILFSGIIFIVFNSVLSTNQMITTIFSTKNEISENSGNFNIRFMLVRNSFDYIINNYLFFGVGFNWETFKSFETYLQNKFIAAPTYDSGYNNIIITFGLWGIIIYSYLFIKIFKSIYYSIKNSQLISHKILSNSLLYVYIYILITAYSSDNFFILNSSAVFILIIALAYTLENNIKINYEKNNITIRRRIR